MISRAQGLAWVALTLLLTLALTPRAPLSAVERGRRVYAGEGCVQCHSQFVRPVPADAERWGAASPRAAALVGNRRQGPDLAAIGRRADAAYLRAHLVAPDKIAPGTVMPAYAHLFAPGDTRGDDLVAYLASLRDER